MDTNIIGEMRTAAPYKRRSGESSTVQRGRGVESNTHLKEEGRGSTTHRNLRPPFFEVVLLSLSVSPLPLGVVLLPLLALGGAFFLSCFGVGLPPLPPFWVELLPSSSSFAFVHSNWIRWIRWIRWMYVYIYIYL